VVNVGTWKAPLEEVAPTALVVRVGTTKLLLLKVGTVGIVGTVGLTVTDTVTDIVPGKVVETPLELRTELI